MADTPGVFTIRQTVLSALNRASQDVKYYEQFAVICTEQLAELNIFHTTQVRIGRFPINSINIAPVTPDYIGNAGSPAFVINNMIHTLTEDDTIPLDTPIDCGLDTNPEPAYNVGSYYPAYIDEWGASHHYAKTGGRNIATWRYDPSIRAFRLRGNIVCTELYVPYVSTGLSLDSETVVPREVVPVLRNYLLWQAIEQDSTVSLGEKMSKKQQYEQSLELLVAFQNSLSVDQIMDAVKQGWKQTPKR